MPVARSSEFERILANLFRKGGWRVRRHQVAGDLRADLVVDDGERKYVVEMKATAEGRRDRLIPLLSQAILQARSLASGFSEPGAPLAVVAARRVPKPVAEHLKQFAARYAPDVAVGVIDAEGFRSFVGAGLERFETGAPRRAAQNIIPQQRLPDLFSDLNQWMLKNLLGPHLPESLIGNVSREPVRNASDLAKAAKVSVMSASRLVHQLESRGFLDESEQHLRIVRVEELLDRWILSCREASKEVPARWIIKRGENQLLAALGQYASRQVHNQPRCCLGLFAAADVLGLGFVRGAPVHIYLERVTLDSLQRLGLTVGRSDRPADVTVRIPANPEAIFRPMVVREGVPVSDVLQVWLDVSTHPTRGREQAREIRRRALMPLFDKRR
jgi:hypothetical protein